jgi:hypothetical protein
MRGYGRVIPLTKRKGVSLQSVAEIARAVKGIAAMIASAVNLVWLNATNEMVFWTTKNLLQNFGHNRAQPVVSLVRNGWLPVWLFKTQCSTTAMNF